jgi:hypothetical protein
MVRLFQTEQSKDEIWLDARREYSCPKSESMWNPVPCAHLAVGIASKVGQTAKVRSGYRVQSLREGRDRQCSHNLARVALLLQSRKKL